MAKDVVFKHAIELNRGFIGLLMDSASQASVAGRRNTISDTFFQPSTQIVRENREGGRYSVQGGSLLARTLTIRNPLWRCDCWRSLSLTVPRSVLLPHIPGMKK